MTRKEFIKRFITVHKCVGCGEILDYELSDSAFCDACRMGCNSALNFGCSDCFKPMRECVCMPKRLQKSGAIVLRKLFYYKKLEAYLPEMKLIFIMKGKKYKRLAEFVAKHLVPIIKEEIDTLGISEEQLVITGVPRGQMSYRANGFDQAQLLSRCIAKSMGIEYRSLLRSRISAKVQKKLDVSSREKNAKLSIRLRKNASADEKYVILIDDVVTSGSSMAACVKCLKRVGARGVLCFALASENKV